MTLYSEIVTGAQFRADLVGSDRVSPSEWALLAVSSVQSAWRIAASARPDFVVASQDFTVASGQSATIDTTLIPDFFDLIDVVANPDTGNEFSLGPFAWANRKAPGNWGPGIFRGTGGATQARLMGTKIYLEPALSAGAVYRVWYCPVGAQLNKMRLITTAALSPGTWSFVFPNELTQAGPSAFGVDGVAAAVGDRLLIKNQVTAPDDGPYVVVKDGAGGGGAGGADLTRMAPFLIDTILRPSSIFYATEGTTNALSIAGALFGVSSDFQLTDTNPTWGPAIVPSIMDQFLELLQFSTAIPAIIRDDDLNPAPFIAEKERLEGEMKEYFSLTRNANNGPARMVDTAALGPKSWSSW